MSTTFSPEDYRIEPANIQTLRCVRSVSLANFPRKVIPSDINNTTECIPQYAMKNTSKKSKNAKKNSPHAKFRYKAKMY